MNSYRPKTYWREKTNQGKVIYKRAKHEFTEADVQRIWARILAKRAEEVNVKRSLLSTLEKLIIDATNYMISLIMKALFLPDYFRPEDVRQVLVRAAAALLKAAGIPPNAIEILLGVDAPPEEPVELYKEDSSAH